MNPVANSGRWRARPPSSDNLPVPVKVSTAPAARLDSEFPVFVILFMSALLIGLWAIQAWRFRKIGDRLTELMTATIDNNG
jgi:hypothetical protein